MRDEARQIVLRFALDAQVLVQAFDLFRVRQEQLRDADAGNLLADPRELFGGLVLLLPRGPKTRFRVQTAFRERFRQVWNVPQCSQLLLAPPPTSNRRQRRAKPLQPRFLSRQFGQFLFNRAQPGGRVVEGFLVKQPIAGGKQFVANELPRVAQVAKRGSPRASLRPA